jgi:hypothetical protein
MPRLPDKAFYSVEIWLQPASANASGTVLAFYSAQHSDRLWVRQSLSDLELRGGIRIKQQRAAIDGVFHGDKPVFITITSDTHTTTVYVDGVPIRTFARI